MGAAGVQPTRNPFPTNAQCNTSLDDAVAFFSRKCRLAGDPVPREVPLPAQTANGPTQIDLYRVGMAGATNDVKRVSWRVSGGTDTQLTPTNRDAMDQANLQWVDMPPGTPRLQWIEAGALMVLPAPNVAGTLLLMLQTSLWSQSATLDGEYLDIIPADYHPIVVAKAVELLGEQIAGDLEMQIRVKIAASKAMDGLEDMLKWANRRNRSYEGGFVPVTGRITTGRGNR